ncbi:hypothetical protein SAMN05216389_1463 [Oceanobacillus limi]|uniref:Uncharacterized protein n=1 Tax=Oceanobacillus limi TaxID=930131 RepID=A0A1I0HQH5_9BACI|nr:hypothetical protein [Oceanobacillus limi]SET86249.1 hypothetical protein SAMN05216389_1463 [Oceanobacillus limi]
MQVGKKVYYDILTGNVILDTGERQGSVIPTTVEQDVQTYKILTERNRETFDVIELEYGQYRQDFRESNGFRVNPETKDLEFSYPDPNEEPQEPVYQKPLSEEVDKLKTEDLNNKEAIADLYVMTMGV